MAKIEGEELIPDDEDIRHEDDLIDIAGADECDICGLWDSDLDGGICKNCINKYGL